MVSEEAHVFVGVKLALSYLSFFQLEGTRALLSSHLHLLRVALCLQKTWQTVILRAGCLKQQCVHELEGAMIEKVNLFFISCISLSLVQLHLTKE